VSGCQQDSVLPHKCLVGVSKRRGQGGLRCGQFGEARGCSRRKKSSPLVQRTKVLGEGLPYSLLSVSDSIDTGSASGKLMLNVLMSVAQWEREAISERTQEAVDELKRRGVRMGGAPYGWQYTKEPDEHGRRNIVTHPCEQKIIHRNLRNAQGGAERAGHRKAPCCGRSAPARCGVGTSDSVSNPRTRWIPDSAAKAQEGDRRRSAPARPDPREDDRDPTGARSAGTGSQPAPDRRKAQEGQNPTRPWRSLARRQRAGSAEARREHRLGHGVRKKGYSTGGPRPFGHPSPGRSLCGKASR